MWTLVVVLMLVPGDLVFTRHTHQFRTEAECRYALGFVYEGRRTGDWEISYAACEPKTSV